MPVNYRVNPVKATCQKYASKSPDMYGIQGISTTCFGICSAFSGTNDTYDMDPACSKACENLVNQRKFELLGLDSCDHQVPYRPVAWGQIPRFTPQLINQGMSKEKALITCKQLCQNVPNLVKECQETCQLDSDAVEVEVVESYSSDGIIVAPTDDDYKTQRAEDKIVSPTDDYGPAKKLKEKVVSPSSDEVKPKLFRGIVSRSSSMSASSTTIMWIIVPIVVIIILLGLAFLIYGSR